MSAAELPVQYVQFFEDFLLLFAIYIYKKHTRIRMNDSEMNRLKKMDALTEA